MDYMAFALSELSATMRALTPTYTLMHNTVLKADSPALSV